jgi:hypothetical protein
MGTKEFPATTEGYAAALACMRGHGAATSERLARGTEGGALRREITAAGAPRAVICNRFRS